MNANIRIGKWLTISVGLTCCFLSLIVISLYLAKKGITIQTFLPRLVRFTLTVLLFVMIYRGARWATWVAIVLFGIAGIMAITSDNEAVHLLSSIYIPSAVTLMLPQVKEYQMYKSKRNNTRNRYLH